jgi:gliding motility-associated-like protein
LSTNPIHEYDDVPESYVVTLFAYNEFGCYDSTLLTVTVYEDLIFYVPNSFTPNGDGTNDIFLPIITSGFDPNSYTLLIFNRWGEILFESHNTSIGWDGTYKPYLNAGNSSINLTSNQEEIMQDGTYTWKIMFNGIQNEDAYEFVGHVNLLK